MKRLPYLIGISALIKGTIFPLATAETVVGSDPADGVHLDDALVSPRHCSFRNSSGQIQLVDLESLNGTFVNGAPTREKTLENGDTIRIGSSEFRFVSLEIPDNAFMGRVDSPDFGDTIDGSALADTLDDVLPPPLPQLKKKVDSPARRYVLHLEDGRLEYNTEVFVGYLLRWLPEEGRRLVEQEFLSNDEAYELLLALEGELRYDYALGELPQPSRRSFEHTFMTTPDEEQRLKVAKALMKRVADLTRQTPHREDTDKGPTKG
jgi:hypothetical protein